MSTQPSPLPGTWAVPYGAHLSGQAEPDDDEFESEFSSFFQPCPWRCRASECWHIDENGELLMEPVTFSSVALGLRGQPWSAFVALRHVLAPDPWPIADLEVTP